MADALARLEARRHGKLSKSGPYGRNVGDTERWVSAVAGGAAAVYGLSRRSLPGVLLAAAGGGLLYRAVTGHSPTAAMLGITAGSRAGYPKEVQVRRAVTIQRPVEEVYRFWRSFENLPRFMHHLESVQVTGETRSHWVAKGPAGAKVEWDAEIINEQPNELIAWRSVEGSDINHAGSVRFEPAPGGRGTEVHVALNYNPPVGQVGRAIAKLFREDPEHQVSEDLRRFKQLMEAGELAHVEGQPSGRR